MVIYLDVLFFINYTINFLLLNITALLLGEPISKRRLSVAALTGSLYALAASFPFVSSFPILLFFGWILCLIAFGYRSLRQSIAVFLVFFSASAACSGFISVICRLSETAGIRCKPTLLILLLAVGLVYIVFGRILNTVHSKPTFATAVISTVWGTVRLRVFKDTGNQLRDPKNNAPVIVAWKKQCLPLFSPEIRSILSKSNLDEAAETFVKLSAADYPTAFRLLPYRTIAANSGLLLVFTPMLAQLDHSSITPISIALCERPLSNGLTFDAIIGT